MKKLFLIFILNSTFILAKQDLRFKIKEKNNENIKILIVKEGREKEKKPKEREKPSIKNSENIYVVKSGDNLTLIAKKFNLSVEYLIEINNIKNKNLITVNQKLILEK